VHRILEDANIKVSCVVSDLFGVSGRAMLEAIVRGKTDPGWLADYARGTLRLKKDELTRAFQGHIGEHHRFVVGELLAELAFLEGRIVRLEAEIERRLQAHANVLERLCHHSRRGAHYGVDANRRVGIGHERFRRCGASGQLGGIVSR
jgi:transposase